MIDRRPCVIVSRYTDCLAGGNQASLTPLPSCRPTWHTPPPYPRPMPDPDLAAAWDAVHEATPTGWYVGRPGFEERYNQWSTYAFDPSERPRAGKRSHEAPAVGPTELECVQEMARCLGELKAGRWPG